MLCKHEVVGSIPSGSTSRARGRRTEDRGQGVTGIGRRLFSVVCLVTDGLVLHREEDVYPERVSIYDRDCLHPA